MQENLELQVYPFLLSSIKPGIHFKTKQTAKLLVELRQTSFLPIFFSYMVQVSASIPFSLIYLVFLFESGPCCARWVLACVPPVSGS